MNQTRSLVEFAPHICAIGALLLGLAYFSGRLSEFVVLVILASFGALLGWVVRGAFLYPERLQGLWRTLRELDP